MPQLAIRNEIYELKLIQEEHASIILEFYSKNKQHIWKYINYPEEAFHNIEWTHAFIQRVKSPINYLIFHNQIMIGLCGFKPTGELGYILDEKYTGKGIIANCIALVMEQNKQQKLFSTITAVINEHNKASQKVAEKAGFIFQNKQENLLHYTYE